MIIALTSEVWYWKKLEKRLKNLPHFYRIVKIIETGQKGLLGGQMVKDDQEQKQFLKEQLQWCKQQDHILQEIERKLHEMRELAQYVLDHELTAIETERLNTQLNELAREVHTLEKQLQSVVH